MYIDNVLREEEECFDDEGNTDMPCKMSNEQYEAFRGEGLRDLMKRVKDLNKAKDVSISLSRIPTALSPRYFQTFVLSAIIPSRT
jgi:hypothetical protein